eukprot:6695713-Karenia_brevis.AAC.1
MCSAKERGQSTQCWRGLQCFDDFGALDLIISVPQINLHADEIRATLEQQANTTYQQAQTTGRADRHLLRPEVFLEGFPMIRDNSRMDQPA